MAEGDLLNPADEAQTARDAAATKLARPYPPGTTLAQPEEPAPDYSVLPSDRRQSDAGEVDLAERFRLDRLNSFYRGTIAGSGRLAAMAHVISTPEEQLGEGERRVRKGMEKDYNGIVADLARYDMLRPWGTTLEGAVALGGTFAGGLMSPESVAGVPARGATFIGRTIKAALQQGAIQGLADPVVQYLNNQAGTEQGYDPLRTVTAAGLGAIIGGGLHAGGELISAAAVKKLRADLAKEDDAFAGDIERAYADAPPADQLPSDVRGEPGVAPEAGATPQAPTPEAARKPSAAPGEAVAGEQHATAPQTGAQYKGWLAELMEKAKQEPAVGAAPAHPTEIGQSGEGWVKTGEQLGSNPGGTYEDAAGTRWYVKVPQSEAHVRNELLANALYRLAHASVPYLQAVTIDGKPAVASRMLPADHQPLGTFNEGSLSKTTAIKSARADFAADAWLANHDVVGLTQDNLLVNPNLVSLPVSRVDQGGALLFRAKGEPKEGFGPKVAEFETMRDAKIAPEAAAVFKGMSDQELVDSLNKVLAIDPNAIVKAVEMFGPTDIKEANKLSKTLFDRRDDLKNIRKDLLAEGAPPPAPAPLPPKGKGKKTGTVTKGDFGKGVPTEATTEHPSGLPMDQAARLERAQKLGFDTGTTWYHGTNAVFDEFSLAKANFEKAIFVTDEPHAAANYGGTKIPLFTRAKDIVTVTAGENGAPKHYNHAFFAKEIAKAHAAGRDAVLFEGFSDIGGTYKQLAVLHPNMLRSIHAAFEPKMKKSAKLAAIEGQKDLSAAEFDEAYRDMLAEARNGMVEARERGEEAIPGEAAAAAESPLQAMAQRQSGATLAGEQQRPAAGTPTAALPATTGGTAGGAAPGAPAAPPPPSPAQAHAIRSLQQQTMSLAEALGMPVRQGRVQIKSALATYNRDTGVARVREVPDLAAVAHEAGHFIQQRLGADLNNLIAQFGHELGPMDYDKALARPEEGFAEFVRHMIGNPAHGQQRAPGFDTAFRKFLGANAPDVAKAIDSAAQAYQSYLRAPSVDVTGAVMRSLTEDPEGVRGVIKDIRERGLPAAIGTLMQHAYTKVLDDKAPVARAVREMARAIRDAAPDGALVGLKAADNPEVLLRLAGRSQQAAIGDMMDGTYGYHATTPEGPSLHDALAKATGAQSKFGKWDEGKRIEFTKYLIDRRAEYLWRRFEAGELENPPVAFSKADATMAMLEREAQNPTFREASDMVHEFTRAQLRKARDAGLLEGDLVDKLLAHEFYVPFMRDMSDKPLAGEPTGGAGGAAAHEGPGMTQVVKKLKGSSRDIIDPIESIMMQTFMLNRTIQHNDVIRSFVRLAERAKDAGGAYVEKIPANEAKKYTFDLGEAVERKLIDKGMASDEAKVTVAGIADLFGEDPLMGSFFRMEPAGKRGEPIVFYRENGQLKAARFMSEREGHAIYETLAAAPKVIKDTWSDLIGATTSVLRTGIISDPSFAVTNYIRDQVAAAILRSDYVPFVGGMKGIAAEFRQSEAAKLYGVGGGVAPGASMAPLEKAIKADVDALAKKGYLVNRLTSVKGVLDLAAFTEAGTRNSIFGTVFEAKRAQGLNDYEAMIEAAFQATDILDFSRHGSHTMLVRRFVPFFNAHLQGLEKAYRTMVAPIVDKIRGDQVFASDPANLNNAIAAWIKAGGVGMALGAGWAALNRDSEAYRDASPVIKGTHLVVPFGNKIFLVPKPFELSLGFTAGEYAYHQWAQDDPRAAAQFATAAWQVLEPPNPVGDIPAIKAYFEQKTGKNTFTGNDIVPDRLARLPAAQQYTDRTSSLAKALGKAINVSPIKIDHAIGNTFGNWGRDIMTLSKGVDEAQPAANWEDYVFLRRLIKDPTRTSDVTTKFWSFMGQTTGTYNQDVAGYENLLATRDDAGAAEFLGKMPARERAYVTLKSAADENGKPAFRADEKRLHPLQRAYDAVTILNGLRRELAADNLTQWADKTPLKLNAASRRDLLDNVRELAQMEMRNAFVIMKEPGYAGRRLLDTMPTLEKIDAIAPQVADEITTRYATAKIYTTESVAKAYPKLERALLTDGSEAAGNVRDMAFDAKGDGFEFGGERVKRPAKRRVVIPAQPAQGAPAAP